MDFENWQFYHMILFTCYLLTTQKYEFMRWWWDWWFIQWLSCLPDLLHSCCILVVCSTDSWKSWAKLRLIFCCRSRYSGKMLGFMLWLCDDDDEGCCDWLAWRGDCCDGWCEVEPPLGWRLFARWRSCSWPNEMLWGWGWLIVWLWLSITVCLWLSSAGLTANTSKTPTRLIL